MPKSSSKAEKQPQAAAPAPAAADAPAPAPAPAAPAAAAGAAADLIDLGTGQAQPLAQTAAADAAAKLAQASTPAAEPGAVKPEVGRVSARAKAGFNNALSKKELIKRGRELALERDALLKQLGKEPGAADDPAEPGAPGAVPALTAQELEGSMVEVVGGIGEFLAAWRGEHWLFTEEEKQRLGRTAAPVVVKVLPMFAEHAAEVALFLAVAGVVMPRLRHDRQLAEQQPKKEGAK